MSFLHAKQLEAVTYGPRENVQILAGPGTGKTHTLVSRAQYLVDQGVPADEILVLSFTNRSMAIFRDRLKPLGDQYQVPVFTFHAFCQTLLQALGPRYFDPICEGFDWNSWIVADVLDSENVLIHCKRHLGLELGTRMVTKNLVSKLSDEKLSPSSKSSSRLRLAALYNKELHSLNMLDYSDLIQYGLELLQKHGHEFLQLQNVLVDELQDTTSTKWNIIRLLCEKSNAALTVVGDPNQSIFGFQGASPEIFRTMEREFTHVKKTTLEMNFRSSRQVVDLTKSLLKNDQTKHLYGTFDSLKPVYKEFGNSHAEATWIGQKITELLQNNPELKPGDFAILHRTNRGKDYMAKVLDKSGLTTISFGSSHTMMQSPAIVPLYSFLKVVAGNQGSESAANIVLLALLRDKTLGSLINDAQSKRIWDMSQRSGKSVLATFKSVWRKLYHGKNLVKLEKMEQLLYFIDTMKSYKLSEPDYKLIWQSLDEFRDYFYKDLELTNDELYYIDKFYEALKQVAEEHPEAENLGNLLSTILANFRMNNLSYDPDRLVSTTVHTAKGLEWPIVFVSGCSDNNFPLQMFENSQVDVEEEKRLLYVACTRAKSQLYITTSRFDNTTVVSNGAYNKSYYKTVPSTTKCSRFLTAQVKQHMTITDDHQHPSPNQDFDNNVLEDVLSLRARYKPLFEMPNAKYNYIGKRQYSTSSRACASTSTMIQIFRNVRKLGLVRFR